MNVKPEKVYLKEIVNQLKNNKMKIYKTIGIVFWIISSLMLGLGLIVFFGGMEPHTSNINIPFIKASVIIFAMTFTMITPVYLNLLFRDSFWKSQEEMDELRNKHHESIRQYNEAKEKLVKAILKNESENK